MRVRDIVYFSPKYRFIDLEWGNKENLVLAFTDRVEGFYLTPARQLNDAGQAFASGVICVTTVDFLARIQTGEEKVGQRIEKWLVDNLSAFAGPDPQNPKRTLAQRFCGEFRNGLVHEGRIKNGGQFSYDDTDLVRIVEPVMIVNPNTLLEGISDSFYRYIKKVSSDELTFQSFRCALIDCFGTDMEIAQM